VKGQSCRPITLDAKGNEQQVNLDKLTVAALEGKTELKALLDWQQAISWRGELKLTGINTAKEVPDWPSKLNGLIKTRGSLYGGSWQMDVPELKITGNVKQNKVDVEGSLQGNSYLQWKIPGLHLALGRNSGGYQRRAGVKDLNLDATIDAPHLDNALPGLGGTAKGLVKVRGTVDARSCWRISPPGPALAGADRCPVAWKGM
jgi:translocation and assembly module TamB